MEKDERNFDDLITLSKDLLPLMMENKSEE